MKPDTMFKFVNVRPVQLAPKDVGQRHAAYGQGKSPLHTQLAALPGEKARAEAVALAEQFLLADAHKPELAPSLKLVRQAVAKEDNAQRAKVAVEGVLGMPLSQWLASEGAKKLKDSIWDAVYAHTVAPSVLPERREGAYTAARTFTLLESLAAVSTPDEAKVEVQTLIPDSVLIPTDLVTRVGKLPVSELHMQALESIRQEVREAAEKVVSMYRAADDLRSGERVYRVQPSTVATFPHEIPQNDLTPLSIAEVSGPLFVASASEVLDKVQAVGETVMIMPRRPSVHQSPRAAEILSSMTLQLLKEGGPALTGLSATKAAEALEAEAYQLASRLVSAIPRGAFGTVAGESALQEMLQRVNLPFAPALVHPPEFFRPNSPEACGIRPLGIGDLLVVKQKLLRYEPGEIAHVENVLKSEKKSRLHKRMREIEETVVTELEQVDESEKNLQTTERFELHKEAEKTIESISSFEAGVSVSAGYGPVSINAHADFALTNSMTESSKTASNYAREVTEKSVSRVQKRAREERARRTLERFEETNEHGFDNTGGQGHVIGVYRWLDKYYKARVVNYGRRLMIEFVVPERRPRSTCTSRRIGL